MPINPIEVQCPHCGAGNRFYRAPNVPNMCVHFGTCQNCNKAIIVVTEGNE